MQSSAGGLHGPPISGQDLVSLLEGSRQTWIKPEAIPHRRL